MNPNDNPEPGNDDRADGDSFDLTDSQKRAVRTLDRNVTLAAGAGSGKTTTLTRRYIAILRAHLDGPDALAATNGDGTGEATHAGEQASSDDGTDGTTVPYRLHEDIEHVSDPDVARRLPEQIVVTTFTERAAEELKHRIREEIYDHLADVDDPETWRCWRAAADGLESGYIHTIHGLCNRLLEEYATLPDAVDPNFDVLEEEEQDNLSNRIATEIVEEEPPEVETLARQYSRSQLVEIVTDLLSERRLTESWIEFLESFEDADEYIEFLPTLEMLDEYSETLHREIEADVDTIGNLLDDPDVQERYGTNPMKYLGGDFHEWWLDWTSTDREECSALDHLEQSLELYDILTNGNNDRYDEGTYFGNKSFRESDDSPAEAFADAMERLLENLDLEGYDIDASPDDDREAYELLRALASLSQEATARYQREKERREVLDYDDLIEETHRLLTDSEDGQLDDLREDIRFVMVDEFQDTNHHQWQLIQALVFDDDFDADNVFLVGDEKQSIYRFRGADVTVFEAARNDLKEANAVNGTPDDGSTLRTNFRTLPPTLAAINGLFEMVFEAGPDNAYEIAPEPLDAGRTGVDSWTPRIEYVPVPVEETLRNRFLEPDHDLRGLPASEPADLEARALANRIAELLADETPVTDDNSNGTGSSTVTPGDIAVLIRSRSELKDYERALRRIDIPYRVVKGEGFFETPEIRALLALCRTLVDPTDDIALYGALRSPLCGLADAELAEAYDPSAEQPLWAQLQDADEDVIQTAVADLRRWRTYAGTAPDASGPMVSGWAALADRILEETGYLAAVAADEREAAAVANVDKFRDRLREFDTEGVPSLEQVVRRLDDQASQDRSEADANVVRDDESVTIMTIHEAKGQEFPVVVVPAIGREFRDQARSGNGSIELERVAHDGSHDNWLSESDPSRVPLLGLKIAGDWSEDDRTTLSRHIAQAQRRREEHAEEKRILYVACTRAEDHLILTGRHTEDDDEPSDIKASDPDDPSSMRDWVQPVLFGTGDEAAESWDTLEAEGQFTRTLPYELDGDQRDGTITIRLPPTEHQAGVRRDSRTATTQRMSYTGVQSWEIRTSPSSVSGLVDGRVQWDIDEQKRQMGTVRVDDDDGFGSADDDDAPAGEHIGADIFGQAVHRLCEVRPPREEWPAFIDQVAAAERRPGEPVEQIPESVTTEIETAAASALDYVTTLHDEVGPQATYDEFPISLAFDSIELEGYIDHLVVIADSYYVVDYKTSRQREEESIREFLDRQKAHHEPQVLAYAAALQQADQTRDVAAQLYFTGVDDVVRWSPDELASARTRVQEIIQDSLQKALAEKPIQLNVVD
jgi:ATP-dependent helicase/nuclease subunit A